nr:hypothetical protein [Tanacetum cinerariifolium]
MRILLLYRVEYSQCRERFMNYLEEQTNSEAMINSIQNGDQPLPIIASVSIAGTAQNAPPRIPNDMYSLIDSNETAKDLWDALERQMRSFEQTKNLMDINIDALYNILNQNQDDVNDALGCMKKAVVVTSDLLALVAEITKQDMSKVKCYNCKKKGHFAKDCKKAKVKDYNYYKTKMLLVKKDSDEQVLLAEDQDWMESSSDSD